MDNLIQKYNKYLIENDYKKAISTLKKIKDSYNYSKSLSDFYEFEINNLMIKKNEFIHKNLHKNSSIDNLPLNANIAFQGRLQIRDLLLNKDKNSFESTFLLKKNLNNIKNLRRILIISEESNIIDSNNEIFNSYINNLSILGGYHITRLTITYELEIQTLSILMHSYDLIFLNINLKNLFSSRYSQIFVKIAKIKPLYFFTTSYLNSEFKNYPNADLILSFIHFVLFYKSEKHHKSNFLIPKKFKIIKSNNNNINIDFFREISLHINKTYPEELSKRISKLYSQNRTLYLYLIINNLNDNNICYFIHDLGYLRDFNINANIVINPKNLSNKNINNLKKFFTNIKYVYHEDFNNCLVNISEIVDNKKNNNSNLILFLDYKYQITGFEDFSLKILNCIGYRDNLDEIINHLISQGSFFFLIPKSINKNKNYAGIIWFNIDSFRKLINYFKTNKITLNTDTWENRINYLINFNTKNNNNNCLIYSPTESYGIQSISRFRDIHKDKDIYIICSGPSLSFLNPSFLENKITIGINYANKLVKCKYSIFKEYASLDLEEQIKKNNQINFVSIYKSGNRILGKTLINKYCFRNPNTIYFDHEENQDLYDSSSLRRISNRSLVVSSSTVTSAMHLAVYMGAKNIILVGHDCGFINNKSNIDPHTKRKDGNTDNFGNNKNKYHIWLKKIENQTVEFKNQIKKELGLNVLSINPFINFSLEGNKFDQHVE